MRAARSWSLLPWLALQLALLACPSGGDGDGGGPCAGRVLVDEVTNARDLGGWPLAGGGSVACEKIFRGGQLGGLSDAGCDAFSALGVRTVVDLREAATQQDEPPPACVADQASLVSAAMPKLLPDTVDNYLALFDEQAAVTALFGALAEADGYPVYVHCVIGRDRASFAAALVLLALGAERPTVVEEFMRSELAGVAVKEACIEAVIDEVAQRGGIEATLEAMGVSSAQLDALRAVAVAR